MSSGQNLNEICHVWLLCLYNYRCLASMGPSVQLLFIMLMTQLCSDEGSGLAACMFALATNTPCFQLFEMA